jgi:hypothetical protein
MDSHRRIYRETAKWPLFFFKRRKVAKIENSRELQEQVSKYLYEERPVVEAEGHHARGMY